MIKQYPEKAVEYKDIYPGFLKDGRNIVSEANPGFTDAWFIDPAGIEGFMGVHDTEKLVITAAEGLISQSEARINALPDESFSEWIDIMMKLSLDPLTWGCCEHMLYIGRRR
jgi:hypothetical protein